MYLSTPELLHRSMVIPQQTYKYGGKFRELCVRTCQMHNFERILANIISTLMGSQGLAYDMTTAQNLYRLNYYWIKFRAMIDALTVESLGGNANMFKNAPDEIRNLVGSVNATRWLSTERTSDHMYDNLSIPASTTLITFVSDSFGGSDSEHWLLAKEYCTCINSKELSHTMLAFWYLANTPGGKKGEGAVGCLSVLGFLGSPYQRITIAIVAALYPIHLSWAKFSDKPAEIGIKPRCASTRSIEGVRFDRIFLESMVQLSSDWAAFIPEAKTFLSKEAKRAVDLKLVGSENEVVEFFNQLMKRGTSSVMAVALKYFFYPGLRPAWSILQVVDPFVGPTAASALLSSLKSLGLIEYDSVVSDEEVPGHVFETPMVIDEEDSERDDISSETDDDSESDTLEGNTRQDAGQDEQETVVADVVWAIDSISHAAPSVTMQQYERAIKDGFSKTSLENVKGIVEAYGLSHRTVVNELISLSQGQL
jgi:hypothetical protein